MSIVEHLPCKIGCNLWMPCWIVLGLKLDVAMSVVQDLPSEVGSDLWVPSWVVLSIELHI